MAAIPLGPAPATTHKLHGVFFEEKLAPRAGAGHWKAVLSQGNRVRHIEIPNSDKYMSRERAEELAKSVRWEDG